MKTTPPAGDPARPAPHVLSLEALDRCDREMRGAILAVGGKLQDPFPSLFNAVRQAFKNTKLLTLAEEEKWLRDMRVYLAAEYLPTNELGKGELRSALAYVDGALSKLTEPTVMVEGVEVPSSAFDASAKAAGYDPSKLRQAARREIAATEELLERSRRPDPKLSPAPEEPRGIPFPSPVGSSSGTSAEPESRGAIVAAESLIRRHRDERTKLRGAIAGANAPGMREALEILDAEDAPPDVDELVGIARGVDAALLSMADLGKRLTFLETAWGVPGKPEMVRVNELRKLEVRFNELEGEVRGSIAGVGHRVDELTKRVNAHRDQFPELRAELQAGDNAIRNRLAELERRGRAQVKDHDQGAVK